MANTWESLDRSQQMALCRQLGAKTPEDHNRIAQHLAQNPTAVDRALKESGMVDAEDDVTLQDGPTPEDNVDDMLAEESSADVQETGEVTSDIPPAEPGEGVEEYIMRLAGMVQQVSENDNTPTGKVVPLRPGADDTLNKTQSEIGMLQGQDKVRRQFQPPGIGFKVRLPIFNEQDL